VESSWSASAHWSLERGFPSLLDYYYLLKYDAAAAEEWGRVFDALAVPETYFWREVDQVRAIVQHVVPDLVRTLGGRPLSIWSIPCASGEEPLSIAMMLDQEGWFARTPIEIHGSDASPAAIDRARRGVYRDRVLPQLAAGPPRAIFLPRRGCVADRSGSPPARHLECRESHGRDPGGTARGGADRLLAQSADLLLRARQP
jgi:chemotaxis methyl-accepting protein methylase